MRLAHFLSLNFRALFVHLSLLWIYSWTFKIYTLEKNKTSPLCILCTIMSQSIPISTLKLVRTWHEESNPWAMNSPRVHSSTIRDGIERLLRYSQLKGQHAPWICLVSANKRRPCPYKIDDEIVGSNLTCAMCYYYIGRDHLNPTWVSTFEH